MKERISELDGMRGFAILVVMLYHFVPPANDVSALQPNFITAISKMGWAGVDLFFVLSGYLITSILLESKGKAQYFRNFYARRVLRIFPVYYFAITILFIYFAVTGLASLNALLKNLPWFYFHLSNWLFSFNAGPGTYFGHLWSLSIEEQFYLLWPLFVYRFDNRAIIRISGVVFLLVLILRTVLVFSPVPVDILNTFPYYASITRLDGLLLGALIATALQSETDKKSVTRSAKKTMAVALFGISASWAIQPSSPLWNNRLMLSVGLSSLAIFAGALIVMLITFSPSSILRRVFGSSTLRFFGKYSYAMYIFHFPIAYWVENWVKSFGSTGAVIWLAQFSISLVLTIIASLLSWNLLEKRMLALKRNFE